MPSAPDPHETPPSPCPRGTAEEGLIARIISHTSFAERPSGGSKEIGGSGWFLGLGSGGGVFFILFVYYTMFLIHHVYNSSPPRWNKKKCPSSILRTKETNMETSNTVVHRVKLDMHIYIHEKQVRNQNTNIKNY